VEKNGSDEGNLRQDLEGHRSVKTGTCVDVDKLLTASSFVFFRMLDYAPAIQYAHMSTMHGKQ